MAVATLEQQKQRAVERELASHTAKIRLLSSADFWESHERGLRQIKEGRTVTFEKLRAKYGTRRSG